MAAMATTVAMVAMAEAVMVEIEPPSTRLY